MYKFFLNFLFFGLIHCMEEAIDTIQLKKKSLINAYPNYPVVGVMLGEERAVNKKNNVWFLEMGEQSFSLQEKVVLSAAKIFLITSNDFDKINNGKTKIYDVQSLISGEDLVKSGILNNETGSKLNFFSDINPYCVIVLLIKKLFIAGQECPLIVDAPSIVCCSDELWKWAQDTNVQEKNIFCDTRDQQFITRTCEKISLNDLQTADSQAIADDFIMIESDEKTRIPYYNDMIAHIAFLGEVFRDNKEFQGKLLGQLKDLITKIPNALIVRQINISKLSKLLEVYGDPALEIINSIASRAAGIGIGFLGSVIKDGLNLLYRVNNTKLEPIPDSERPKIKESIEIFYNKNIMESANAATLLPITVANDNNNKRVFVLDGRYLVDKPWIFKAHQITLYEGDLNKGKQEKNLEKDFIDGKKTQEDPKTDRLKEEKEDCFSTLQDSLINSQIAQKVAITSGDIEQACVVDLTKIQNAHLVLYLPTNYLQSKAKHQLCANWVTIASFGNLKNDLQANRKASEYFSSLEQTKIGLVCFNEFINCFTVTGRNSDFSGYPKQNVTKYDASGLKNELVNSYRGEQQFENIIPQQPNNGMLEENLDEDNIDSTKLQKEFADSNKPKENLIQKIDQIIPFLLNKDQKFNTQNCIKLLGYSNELNQLTKYSAEEEYATKRDLISTFFTDTIATNKISWEENKNIKIVKSSDDQFFIVPAQVISFLKENKDIPLKETASLEYSYDNINLPSFELQEKLQDLYNNPQPKDELHEKEEKGSGNEIEKDSIGKQYNNKSQDESDSKQSKPVLLLETNNPVESEEKPPVEQQPLDTKWSWYKPWTWSWGGYYFRRASYFKSKPDEARQYEQRLAEESR